MQKTILLLALAFLGLSNANAQVGIGTTSPDASAVLDVDVSSLSGEKKGFLPPRISKTERDDITDPATGLTIYNTDTDCVQFYTGATWYNLCDINLVAPSVYSPNTGQIWMDRNLGANQVATAPDDAAAYGDLYQWGRAADGHEKIFRVSGDDPTSNTYPDEFNGDGVANFEPLSANAWNGLFVLKDASSVGSGGIDSWIDPTATDGAGNTVSDLWQGVDGVNNPCPTGYRLPTQVEINEERVNSFTSNDLAGAFGSPLKLTAPGARRRDSGNVSNDGSFGAYWTSGVSGDKGGNLFLNSTSAGTSYTFRSLGYAIRCIKD